MSFDPKNWTFGAEHELADWPALLLGQYLPDFSRDTKDITCVNSNGIANDPKLRYYIYGGEINTPPTDSIDGQGACLAQIVQAFPNAKVNYRSNLHFHIRVPGLRDHLDALKCVAIYNATHLPSVLRIIEPIPTPRVSLGVGPKEPTNDLTLRGAMRRWNRRKRSHHTVLPESRLALQLEACTLGQFFAAEVPHTKAGRPMWHAQARAAVNVRQLIETDTIEFRHFPGTLDPNKVTMAGLWCKVYMQCALEWEGSPTNLNPLEEFRRAGGDIDQLPKFEPYNHGLEVRYRATVHDGTIPKEQIARNIAAILDGSFDDVYWNRAYNW